LGGVRAEHPATGRPDRLLRAQLKCPDIDGFVEQFAGRITREGMFFPSREPRPAGSVIRFELVLLDGAIAFSGEGAVVSVKQPDPGQPNPSGMTVQFTALAAASTLVLERLIERRELQSRRRAARGAADPGSQDAANSESSAAAKPGSPVDTDPASPPSMAAEPSPPVAERRINVGMAVVQSEPMPLAAPARDRTPPSARPSRAHLRRVLAWSAATTVAASLGYFMAGRPPHGSDAAQTPIVAAAKPVPSALPPAVAPVPLEQLAAESSLPAAAPPQAPAAPVAETEKKPPASASVRVESILTGASYVNHTCPERASEFSVKAHRHVNVCIQMAPATQPSSELVKVLWERNGTVHGETSIRIATRHTRVRTRVRFGLHLRRLGDWSVRLVSHNGVELARSTFHVVP
jgi:hypothetical protein